MFSDRHSLSQVVERTLTKSHGLGVVRCDWSFCETESCVDFVREEFLPLFSNEKRESVF